MVQFEFELGRGSSWDFLWTEREKRGREGRKVERNDGRRAVTGGGRESIALKLTVAECV